ncbi:MAG: hypothetical protein JOZ73_09485 [Solirubrobacterales bacterium]|nr:hypothetical protein [Solirubrobacterales bacterium]
MPRRGWQRVENPRGRARLQAQPLEAMAVCDPDTHWTRVLVRTRRDHEQARRDSPEMTTTHID